MEYERDPSNEIDIEVEIGIQKAFACCTVPISQEGFDTIIKCIESRSLYCYSSATGKRLQLMHGSSLKYAWVNGRKVNNVLQLYALSEEEARVSKSFEKKFKSLKL